MPVLCQYLYVKDAYLRSFIWYLIHGKRDRLYICEHQYITDISIYAMEVTADTDGQRGDTSLWVNYIL